MVKTFSQIVRSYHKYLSLQFGKFSSYESQDQHWSAGQKRFIDIFFADWSRQLSILDIACGDGVGLREFRRLGYEHVVGVELNPQKAKRASRYGYPVFKADIHDISPLGNQRFDVIYCSHTLEHAYRPAQVIKEFRSHLTKRGLLLIVLPYPDVRPDSEQAHGARYELGTNRADDAAGLIKFFAKHGFRVIDHFFDTFREPEVWLVLQDDTRRHHHPYTKIIDKLQNPTASLPFYRNDLYSNQAS